MFADNGKISARQVGCLLFADWIGKLSLLLPQVRGDLRGWNFVLAAAAGGVWTCLYIFLLAEFPARMRGSYTDYMRERLGKYPAYFVGVLFLFYLLINVCYLARLTGRICSVYLLPETSETVIAAAVFAVGMATASGDRQKRPRAAEFFFFPIAAALALMLAASIGNVRAAHFQPQSAFAPLQILKRSGAVFAGFSGVSLVLYEAPFVNRKGRKLRSALTCGLLVTLAFLLASFVIALGVLGEKSFARLPWPVLALMGSASLPGGFLQRWDAVFLAFLLFSLLLAAGTSCHYLRRISGEIAPGNQRDKVLWIIYLLAFLLILATGTYGTAAELFYRGALCCLLPLTAAVPVFLLIIEKCGKRRG